MKAQLSKKLLAESDKGIDIIVCDVEMNHNANVSWGDIEYINSILLQFGRNLACRFGAFHIDHICLNGTHVHRKRVHAVKGLCNRYRPLMVFCQPLHMMVKCMHSGSC